MRKFSYSAIAETTIGALRARAPEKRSAILLLTLIGFRGSTVADWYNWPWLTVEYPAEPSKVGRFSRLGISARCS